MRRPFAIAGFPFSYISKPPESVWFGHRTDNRTGEVFTGWCLRGVEENAAESIFLPAASDLTPLPHLHSNINLGRGCRDARWAFFNSLVYPYIGRSVAWSEEQKNPQRKA